MTTPRRRALRITGALGAAALALSAAPLLASADADPSPASPSAAPSRTSSPASSSASGTAASPASSAAQLQRLLDAVPAAGVPAAVAQVRSGRSVWRGAAGRSDLTTRRRARPGDRFRIGSATKNFTATVVLQLVGERRIRLTDTVQHLLPGLLPKARGVTVRDLLGMRSGIASYTDVLFPADDPAAALRNRYRTWTPRQLVGLVARAPLGFAPGTRYEYSNTNFVLLGMIVEKVTRHSLPAEVQRRILTPLHLRSTSFPTTDPRVPEHALHGYVTLDAKSPRLDFTRQNVSWAWAAGGMISTVGDLATYWRAQLSGKLLRADLLRRMLTDTIEDGGSAYGLGIEVTSTPCGTAYGHAGDIPAYSTRIYTTRDGARQVVVAQSQLFAQNSDRAGAALGAFIAAAFCGSSSPAHS